MSMTREEAIALLNEQYETCKRIYDCSADQRKSYPNVPQFMEALGMALSALRPVSREQVEKVWSGCDFCNTADFGEFGFEITKHYAKICCALGSWRFPEKEQFLFCPKCGKPLTDEGVQMAMERLEADCEPKTI